MEMREKCDITELLMRCRAHDDAAFSELVNLYAPMINKNVSSYFEESFDVSEAFSEACAVLHQAAISYDLNQSEVTFGLYAGICIRNRMLDMLRRRRTAPPLSDIDIESLAVGDDIESRLIMRETVGEYQRIARDILSEYEYKVFLCLLRGFKTAEISQVLGKSAKSVDNAKARIFRAMRDKIGKTQQ